MSSYQHIACAEHEPPGGAPGEPQPPPDPPSLPEQLDNIAADLRQWAGEDMPQGERLALRFAAVHVDAAAACVRLAMGGEGGE